MKRYVKSGKSKSCGSASSCSKSKGYVKSEVDIDTAESVLDSLCRSSYNTDSLYEMCFYFAGKYYEALYGEDWDGMYPDAQMYGKAEKGKWYIAFPMVLGDSSELVEVCFGKTNGWAMPVEYFDFKNNSYIVNNFEYIYDIEPAYLRYENTIYEFRYYGFEPDEDALDDAYSAVTFTNSETGEILDFQTWEDAEDYVQDNF